MSRLEPLKNWLRPFLGRRRVPNPDKIVPSPQLEAALALENVGMPSLKPDAGLAALAKRILARPSATSALELFTLEGQLLPCWVPEDIDPADDWLTNDRAYPLYYRLFQEIALLHPIPRLLEIGVRTGYVGVVFARAVNGPSRYVGIDPDQYRADGLARANASFTRIRARQPGFDFRCLHGYSDNPRIQSTVLRRGPYNIVHVDGDHTNRGKLVDLEFARSVLAPGGLVLVDDYDYIPGVIQESIGRAVRLGWYSRFATLATHRGLGILQV